MSNKKKSFKKLKSNLQKIITTVALGISIASCHPGKQDNIVDEAMNSPDTAALVQQIGEKINFGVINTAEQEKEFSKLLADSAHYAPLLNELHVNDQVEYQNQIQGSWNQITNRFVLIDSLLSHLERGKGLTADSTPKELKNHLKQTENLYYDITVKFEDLAKTISFFRKHFGVEFGNIYKARIVGLRTEIERGPLKSEYAKLGRGLLGSVEDMQTNLLETYRRKLVVIENAMFD